MDWGSIRNDAFDNFTQLIAKLLEKEPSLAVRSAIFDLADSLAALLDEM